MQKLLHTLYITEPDTVLRRDGEALVAVHANGREDHIPLHLLDRIVCFSGASISPAVIDACVKHDVGFSALSQSGRFCFRLNGPTTGNVLLRKKQYTLPCENRLYLAKRMLHGKLEGQATVLGRFRRNHPSELLRATEEAIRTIAEQLPMAVTNEQGVSLRRAEPSTATGSLQRYAVFWLHAACRDLRAGGRKCGT